jgi:hypothetical protein
MNNKTTLPLISFLTFMLLLFSACRNKTIDEALQLDLTKEISTPKHYIIAKCEQAPIIDGLDSDEAWEKAPFTDLFTDIAGGISPKYDTRCKMTWDEEFLYIYAELEEEHIWGDITERDAIIYLNNDFEVFIDPGGKGKPYGEIEINALGTVWDLLMTNSYRLGGKAVFDWNLLDMKSAVHHSGSLNDPGDLDSLWSVELAIPMQGIADLKNHKAPIPKEGEQWRINFSRVHWDYDLVDGKYQRKKENGEILPEFNWVWSPMGVINMHIPEKWAFLQFTHQKNAAKIGFITDEDQEAKQVMYALFRHFRLGPNGYTRAHYEDRKLTISILLEDEEKYIASYTPTQLGFEVRMINPASQNTFVINQESELQRIKKEKE